MCSMRMINLILGWAFNKKRRYRKINQKDSNFTYFWPDFFLGCTGFLRNFTIQKDGDGLRVLRMMAGKFNKAIDPRNLCV